MRWLLLLGMGVGLPPAGGAPAADPLPGWLAGCWRGGSGGDVVEEQWMAPRGGVMLGMARTVTARGSTSWESLRIEERPEGLVYLALPSGQAATEFAATARRGTSITFENPSHDFPQRIAYRLAGVDALVVRVESAEGDRGFDLRMVRAACGGAG